MYLMQNLLNKLFFLQFFVFLNLPVVSKAIVFSEPVTFEQAFQLAVEHSPRGFLLEALQDFADGQIEEAGYIPNPSVGVEIENVLGTGKFEEFDGSEVTLGIYQLIERREKRKRRSELAIRTKGLFRWDYEEAMANLRYAVMQAYSNALVAQKNVELQEELLELEKASEAEVARRADAAIASSIEVSRAKLATKQQAFKLGSSRRQLREAKIILSSLWNRQNFVDFTLAGRLEIETPLPGLSALIELVDTVPSIARFEAEREAQEIAVDLEKAKSKADYKIFGGARYLREGRGDAAFVLGIEMPWKIRNENEGNIRSALSRLRVLDSQKRVVRQQAIAEISVNYSELASSIEEWKSLSENLLPSAQAALAETEIGYQRGIVPLLNVLDARKSLFEIRTAMLESTGRYLNAQAEIERLTRPVNTYGDTTPQARLELNRPNVK